VVREISEVLDKMLESFIFKARAAKGRALFSRSGAALDLADWSEKAPEDLFRSSFVTAVELERASEGKVSGTLKRIEIPAEKRTTSDGLVGRTRGD